MSRGVVSEREVSLVEVLDRALGAGVVITGDVTLSLADIDLVYLSLRLVVGSVPTLFGESDEVGESETDRPWALEGRGIEDRGIEDGRGNGDREYVSRGKGAREDRGNGNGGREDRGDDSTDTR
jgi:hypothetical protein